MAVFLLFAAQGASAADGDKSKAEGAAKTFLQQLESGDIGTAYDERVAPTMKAMIDRQTFVQQIGMVRVQTGGTAEARLLVGSQDFNKLPTGQTGDFYYVRFKSRFPSALLFQDVYLEKSGDRWLVLGVFNLPAPAG